MERERERERERYRCNPVIHSPPKGSHLKGAKPSELQAAPREVRPERSWLFVCGVDIYTYVCMYIYIYIYIFMYIYIYINMYIYIYIYIFMYIYISLSLYISLSIYIYIYIYMHLCSILRIQKGAPVCSRRRHLHIGRQEGFSCAVGGNIYVYHRPTAGVR